MSQALTRDQRMQLINMVCSFAWMDFEVDDVEHRHITDLCARLDLDSKEQLIVGKWLVVPPDTEELADPGAIPLEHREAFLEECQRVILVDGIVDPEESMAYRLFRKILMSQRGSKE